MLVQFADFGATVYQKNTKNQHIQHKTKIRHPSSYVENPETIVTPGGDEHSLDNGRKKRHRRGKKQRKTHQTERSNKLYV